jgi:hypothetical protein
MLWVIQVNSDFIFTLNFFFFKKKMLMMKKKNVIKDFKFCIIVD